MRLDSPQDVRTLLDSLLEFTGDKRSQGAETGKRLRDPSEVEQLLRDFLVEFFGMEVKGL